MNMQAWDECGSNVSDAELFGLPCYGGLDLSATTDLSAFVLVIPYDGRVYVRHWAWVPGENIIERERRDRVPYRQWAKEGRIELVDGAVISPQHVVRRVIELSQRWNIQRIQFDRWGLQGVVEELEGAGFTVAQMGQGYGSMSTPTKQLEADVLSRRLAHGGCPLLRWQASCATISTDPAGNVKLVKPDRLKHTKRIDSVVALVMAVDGLLRCGNAPAAMDEFLASPLML
jgi:phage terminase large subunit-like protein